MKPQRRRSIEVEINMMSYMKPPKKWNSMREVMPNVQRVIQQDYGEHNFQPPGQSQLFQQTPPVRVNELCEWKNHRPLNKQQRAGAHGGYCDIARTMRQLGLNFAAQRAAPLQPYKRSECA